jgi:replicative DNA helicase
MSALAVARTIDVVTTEHPAEGLQPPHSLEAEASVLSAVILDPSAILKIGDFLRPEHMYSEAHRWIYAGCLALHEAATPIDVRLVGDWLKDRGRLAQIGGAGYLTEILDACPVVANVRHHALVVYEKWRARQIILAAEKIRAVGYTDYGDTQTYCDRAVQAVARVAQSTVLGRPETNRETLIRIARRLAEGSEAVAKGLDERKDRVRGIPTGIYSYDRLTAGLHSGQKTTITAHPGIGKTAFAMQIAWTVAEGGLGVVVFSTEMSREELLEREVCRRSSIPFERLQRGQLRPEEWSRFTATSSQISELPVVIDDTTDIDIDQIRASLRSYAETMPRTHAVPLGLCVLDYIQNLRPAVEVEFKKEHEQVKFSTRRFSQTLKDLSIPGIELAQRKPEGIDPKTKLRPKPVKGCIADSSWIEKSSHVCVGLQRRPLHNDSGLIIGEDERYVDAHVFKQRGGRERPLELRFEGDYARFSDPNEPGQSPARQYVDRDSGPEPPPGRFEESDNHFTEGL